MPHTLQYRPVLIDALISNERIASYARVFRPSNDVELIGAYLWNVHVCSALYPLVSSVEIALRNAIDQALVADMGAFWWSASKLKYRSYKADAPPPRAVQAVHENFVKATRKTINEMRGRHHVRGRITPRHADVLAKAEFSTWGYLLDAEFMGRGLIWPKHLSAVFRGPWPVRRAGATLALSTGSGPLAVTGASGGVGALALSIFSRPRWRATMCLTMLSPRPVPPVIRDRAGSTR